MTAIEARDQGAGLDAPRVPGHWLFGSALDLAAAPHRFAAEAARARGGIASFRIFARRWLTVCDPDLARQILVTRQQAYQRSFHYTRGQAINGPGLIHVDGPRWLRRRRQMLPMFRRDRLADVVEVTIEAADLMLARWQAASQRGEPVEVVAEGQRLTLAVMGEALLSSPVDPDQAVRLAQTINRAMLLLRKRNTGGLALPLWLPTPTNRSLRKSRAAMDQHLAPHLEARRTDASIGKGDILHALLAVRDPDSGEPLTDDDVLAEGKTLFSAGFETTANTFAWMMWLLAGDRQLQDALAAEAKAVLGDRAPALADLDRLPTFAAVIDETLRLYPPVYTLARVATADDRLGPYRVRHGTVVLISVYGLHRHPDHWRAPDTFDPSRFIDRKAPPHPAYMPFAIGKHVCIGNNFALLELAVALLAIVRRFRVSRTAGETVGVLPRITLAPDGPIRLQLDPC